MESLRIRSVTTLAVREAQTVCPVPLVCEVNAYVLRIHTCGERETHHRRLHHGSGPCVSFWDDTRNRSVRGPLGTRRERGNNVAQKDLQKGSASRYHVGPQRPPDVEDGSALDSPEPGIGSTLDNPQSGIGVGLYSTWP